MAANGPIIFPSLSFTCTRLAIRSETRVPGDESSRFREMLRQPNGPQERSSRDEEAGKPALNRGAQTDAPHPRY